MCARTPSVSKRPNVPGIIDLAKFNYEDLEEIVAGRPAHLGFIRNASRYIHTHYAYAIAVIVYSKQVFSSHDSKF